MWLLSPSVTAPPVSMRMLAEVIGLSDWGDGWIADPMPVVTAPVTRITTGSDGSSRAPSARVRRLTWYTPPLRFSTPFTPSEIAPYRPGHSCLVWFWLTDTFVVPAVPAVIAGTWGIAVGSRPSCCPDAVPLTVTSLPRMSPTDAPVFTVTVLAT